MATATRLEIITKEVFRKARRRSTITIKTIIYAGRKAIRITTEISNGKDWGLQTKRRRHKIID